MNVVISPSPVLQFVDENGAPLVGGLLFTYQGGTTTLLTTYADSQGVTPNPNPIVLNALGEPPKPIFIPPSTKIKYVLAPPGSSSPPTSVIWTVDNVSSALPGQGTMALQNANNVLITGGIITVSTLTVTGAGEIGALTVDQNASVGVNFTVGGTTILTGQVTASAALGVGGNATIDGTLGVDGAVNILGVTTLNNNVAFTQGDNALQITNANNDAGGDAGTLTNAPTAGNPTFWLKVKINGVSLAIPAWPA